MNNPSYKLVKYSWGPGTSIKAEQFQHKTSGELHLVVNDPRHAALPSTGVQFRIMERSATLATIPVGQLAAAAVELRRDNQSLERELATDDLPIYAPTKGLTIALSVRPTGQHMKYQLHFVSQKDCETVKTCLFHLNVMLLDRTRPSTAGSTSLPPLPTTVAKASSRPSTANANLSTSVERPVEEVFARPALPASSMMIPPVRELPAGFPKPPNSAPFSSPGKLVPGSYPSLPPPNRPPYPTIYRPSSAERLSSSGYGSSSPLTRSSSPTLQHTLHQRGDFLDQMHGSFRKDDLLAMYAAQPSKQRSALLDAFIVESLEDVNFRKLCEDVDACWQAKLMFS